MALIKIAIEPLGYTPIRGDETTQGSITRTIINSLLDAPLAIADLTGWNCNVLYELGIRHAAQRKAIQLMQIGQNPPFNVQDVATIYIVIENQEECIATIRSAAQETVNGRSRFNLPHIDILGAQVLRRAGKEKERAVLRFLDQHTDSLSQRLDQLRALLADVGETGRRPLRGIHEVLAQFYYTLQAARKGGAVWFVGMSLGIGPPHAYRLVKDGEQLPPRSIGELFRSTWTDLPEFDALVDEINDKLTLLLKHARLRRLVCLDHRDDSLRTRFLNELVKRASYRLLASNIGEVEQKMKKLHYAALPAGEETQIVHYCKSIPLQILIVELQANSDRKPAIGCIVFHVGSGDAGSPVLENGETGFYTEVDSVVEMCQNTAESLWEMETYDAPVHLDQPS